MNLGHDRKPQFVGHQIKRLEKRFEYLASTQRDGHRRAVTKEAFCSQPEISTNAFVAAYIDRLLEQRSLEPDKEHDATISTKSDAGSSDDHHHRQHHQREEATRKKDGLTFTDFVHVFWVFSASASRAEKGEVVEALLDPDKRGRVDRWRMFRFVKRMLPGVPDRALDGVVDDLTETIRAGSETQGAHVHDSSIGSSARKGTDNTSSRSQIFIGEFLERGDFVDRLTLHM